MPFRRPRVWAGGKPAIPMRVCAGVVHAFGSRRLEYPVTTFARPGQTGPRAGPGASRKGSLLASWLSTTDHKIIGQLYLITSFGFFLIAGLMAMIMRAQLFGPDNHIVSDQQYNELTGKMLDNTLGKWHFWTLFIRFWMTFLVHHWAGIQGMPRRIANYPFLPGDVTVLNQISSIGSWILGASTFFFLYNVYKTWKYGKQVTKDDPWGYANSLEWVTSCPPPRHNFTRIPRIRSERPAFDLHYPHIQTGRYLEAEFYSYAVRGEGLPEDMTHGTGQRGPVEGGREVGFQSRSIRQFAAEIARDEFEHVAFFRSALGSAAVARPASKSARASPTRPWPRA